MANDDILRRDGVLARITGFDEGRTAYYAVMPNGHSTQLTFPSQEIFDIGDVLLVGKDFYTKVPPSVWPVKPRVGVIRRALEDCVVIETSDGLELLEGEYPVDIAPGNTVEFTDLFGIERVLWPTAIRPGESDHDDDIKQYRLTPSADPSLTFAAFGGYERVIAREGADRDAAGQQRPDAGDRREAHQGRDLHRRAGYRQDAPGPHHRERG